MQPQLVDLSTVAASACEALWDHERHWWQTLLLWDIADSIDALRRVMARGSLPGHALRVGTQIVGYLYAMRDGELGVLSALTLAPTWDRPDTHALLLQSLVDRLRRQGVRRIESPCITPVSPWLVPTYERLGFRTMWRTFLRISIAEAQLCPSRSDIVQLEAWQSVHLQTAASIMQRAYQATIDVEMNQLYRSVSGCQSVCEQLLYQGGCGPCVADASSLASVRGEAAGFLLATAIAPAQAHLAQIAVLPTRQRAGIGRQLVQHCVTQLHAHRFETLSLVVSCANRPALALYQALGMREILTFPVFVWEAGGNSA